MEVWNYLFFIETSLICAITKYHRVLTLIIFCVDVCYQYRDFLKSKLLHGRETSSLVALRLCPVWLWPSLQGPLVATVLLSGRRFYFPSNCPLLCCHCWIWRAAIKWWINSETAGRWVKVSNQTTKRLLLTDSVLGFCIFVVDKSRLVDFYLCDYSQLDFGSFLYHSLCWIQHLVGNLSVCTPRSGGIAVLVFLGISWSCWCGQATQGRRLLPGLWLWDWT